MHDVTITCPETWRDWCDNFASRIFLRVHRNMLMTLKQL